MLLINNLTPKRGVAYGFGCAVPLTLPCHWDGVLVFIPQFPVICLVVAILEIECTEVCVTNGVSAWGVVILQVVRSFYELVCWEDVVLEGVSFF